MAVAASTVNRTTAYHRLRDGLEERGFARLAYHGYGGVQFEHYGRGGLVVVLYAHWDRRDGGRLLGTELYVPSTVSNRIDATLASLDEWAARHRGSS